MYRFWYSTTEMTPPTNRKLWVTENPFIAAPKIRLDNWNGEEWVHHKGDKAIYWAFPINRKK